MNNQPVIIKKSNGAWILVSVVLLLATAIIVVRWILQGKNNDEKQQEEIEKGVGSIAQQSIGNGTNTDTSVVLPIGANKKDFRANDNVYLRYPTNKNAKGELEDSINLRANYGKKGSLVNTVLSTITSVRNNKSYLGKYTGEYKVADGYTWIAFENASQVTPLKILWVASYLVQNTNPNLQDPNIDVRNLSTPKTATGTYYPWGIWGIF